MEIKILEYQVFKGNKVRVRSHNFRKGKWKENKNYEWHKRVAAGLTSISGFHPILYKREYEVEVYDDKNQYKEKVKENKVKKIERRKNENKNWMFFMW